jgi:hypothetical protein
VNDDIKLVVKLENQPFPDAAHAAHNSFFDGFERRVDGPENERTAQAHSLQGVPDNVPRQRLAIDDDVRQFGQLLPEPRCYLLPRPMMVVVQMQDNRVERQPLLATDGASAPHVFETVE